MFSVVRLAKQPEEKFQFEKNSGYIRSDLAIVESEDGYFGVIGSCDSMDETIELILETVAAELGISLHVSDSNILEDSDAPVEEDTCTLEVEMFTAHQELEDDELFMENIESVIPCFAALAVILHSDFPPISYWAIIKN